jgi:hypothetical protein
MKAHISKQECELIFNYIKQNTKFVEKKLLTNYKFDIWTDKTDTGYSFVIRPITNIKNPGVKAFKIMFEHKLDSYSCTFIASSIHLEFCQIIIDYILTLRRSDLISNVIK